MSNAEQMFKDLGFRKKVYGSKINYMKRTKEGNMTYYEEIEFSPDYKFYETWFYHDNIVESMVIHLDTHKAITQQMLELGWLDT